MTRLSLLAACWLGVFLIAGCGDGRPSRAPVSGQVLIDGEPLTLGTITLNPQGARSSRGKIGEDGRFSLSCYESDDGVVLGTHRVAVMANEPIGDSGMKWFAPKKYSNFQTSGLELTIDGEQQDLKIELTWDGDKHGKPYVEGSKGKSDSNEGENF